MKVVLITIAGLCSMLFTPAAMAAPVTGQQTYGGKTFTVTLTPLPGSSKRSRVSIANAAKTEVARLTIDAKQGLDDSIVQLCKAKEILNQGKTAAGCFATAASGACLYTGLGGGVGAAYCVATIDYAVDTGAIDCVKGLAAYIAKLAGDNDLLFTLSATKVTPTDLLDTSIDKACEAWEQQHHK